ncbi:maleylpyruvate isomerase family mycothiol-dependent enzyme [Blastococcus haudaquaticus]|uniref:TIGR03083 family protein n=1 Tax=Blastococcus haudaquaticus TaxID=1938745 RepID=A0A286H4I4_9ACTN|nr:maleylpyruvate isomerase family mycothiol-dependent enzyme [Blastococcus haudaquaticus]SOE02376.1 TIGR03083 family protein [Blastococcus haudaquaticus]
MPRTRSRVQLLPVVEAERLDLADFLESLDEREWVSESLCTGWTVHDVVAHLTLSARQTLGETLLRVAAARGNLERAEADWARELAAEHSPAELITQLRASAGRDHRLAFSSPLDPLTDVVVHGQDIAIPLGRRREMPPPVVLPVIGHVWGNGFYGRADRRFAGLRFVATDTDWSAGEGPREVRGRIGDLLLVATGRAAGLDNCCGPGVGEAEVRLRGSARA